MFKKHSPMVFWLALLLAMTAVSVSLADEEQVKVEEKPATGEEMTGESKQGEETTNDEHVEEGGDGKEESEHKEEEHGGDEEDNHDKNERTDANEEKHDEAEDGESQLEIGNGQHDADEASTKEEEEHTDVDGEADEEHTEVGYKEEEKREAESKEKENDAPMKLEGQQVKKKKEHYDVQQEEKAAQTEAEHNANEVEGENAVKVEEGAGIPVPNNGMPTIAEVSTTSTSTAVPPKKTEQKSSTWGSLISKLLCLIGFHCPEQTMKEKVTEENSPPMVGNHHVHRVIAIELGSGEGEQDVEDPFVEVEKKEQQDEASEKGTEQPKAEEVNGELKAVAVETTVDEQGEAQSNVTMVNAGFTQ